MSSNSNINEKIKKYLISQNYQQDDADLISRYYSLNNKLYYHDLDQSMFNVLKELLSIHNKYVICYGTFALCELMEYNTDICMLEDTDFDIYIKKTHVESFIKYLSAELDKNENTKKNYYMWE